MKLRQDVRILRDRPQSAVGVPASPGDIEEPEDAPITFVTRVTTAALEILKLLGAAPDGFVELLLLVPAAIPRTMISPIPTSTHFRLLFTGVPLVDPVAKLFGGSPPDL